MKINMSSLPYLQGKKFSNSYLFAIADNCQNIDRISYIENTCRKKKVIHIGFADHIPLVPEKIRKNIWLHKRILNVASHCIGVDTDKNAITYFENNYQFKDLYLHDVIEDEPLSAIVSQTWDYMILGEILEHVDNPVLFLHQLLNKYGEYCRQIIITVPNATNINSIRMARKHLEYINTDHRFWFTPYTLAKVGTRAGWLPVEWNYCQTNIPASWIAKRLVNRFPAYRETLVMTFESSSFRPE